MKKSAIAALVVASGVGVTGFVGAGSAQAAPADCRISVQPTGATAACSDADAPPGREYTVVVQCLGVFGMPYALPFVGTGPYQGGWGGSFAPTGQGSASCIGPLSVGVATGAYVAVYRE